MNPVGHSPSPPRPIARGAATSNASWLAATSGGQVLETALCSYVVARNSDVLDRSASIAVAGNTFAVRQTGDIGVCQDLVAPVDFNPCMPRAT